MKRKKPQGHTKRDEPSSPPHSVSQQPVSDGKTERKRGWNTGGVNPKVHTHFKLHRCDPPFPLTPPQPAHPCPHLPSINAWRTPAIQISSTPQVIWLRKHPNLSPLCALAEHQAPLGLFVYHHLYLASVIGRVSVLSSCYENMSLLNGVIVCLHWAFLTLGRNRSGSRVISMLSL